MYSQNSLTPKSGFIATFTTVAAILLIVLSGCDFNKVTDAADDFRLIIGLEPINTTPTLLLTDAGTGELISGNVTVTFSGPNGADVVDIYSDPMGKDEVADGILTFGIRNAVTPSETSPAKINLLLEASGYITASKTIILKGEGASDFSITMLSKQTGQQPDGISTTIDRKALAAEDGSLRDDLQVDTRSVQNLNSGVSVQLPAGLVFANADGEALTGTLTAALTYYDPDEKGALAVAPVELTDSRGDGMKIAGISSIEITDPQGQRATSIQNTAAKSKSATQEFLITFTLPDNYTNSATGAPLEEGDDLRMVAYDQNFERLEESTVQAELLANGKLGVLYRTQTVPYILVVGTVLNESESCRAEITIERNGNTGLLTGSASGSGFFTGFNLEESAGSVAFDVPNEEITIEIETATLVHTVQANLCSQSNLTVNLPAPPQNVIDVAVDVILSCVNKSEQISITDLPGASLAYRKADAAQGTRWRLAKNIVWNYDETDEVLTGGSFDIPGVEKDENYTFKLNYNGKTYQKTELITGPTMVYEDEIDEDVCQ